MNETANNRLIPSATVILARDKDSGPEFYLLQRSSKSGFMGGLYVFPGGVVETEDRSDCFFRHMDLGLEDFRARFENGDGIESAMAFCVAAVRETLEEAGIFIADPAGKASGEFRRMAVRRLAKDLPKDWFKTEVALSNWIICMSSLYPWSRWITPVGMKKRFDTCFYVVPLPPDQTCATDNRETANGTWLSPLTALKLNLTGEIPLSPPAIVTLTQLLALRDMAALQRVLAQKRWEAPFAPRLTRSKNGPIILEPWDPLWDSNEDLAHEDCTSKTAAPGEPFSRIWLDRGVWKPVRA